MGPDAAVGEPCHGSPSIWQAPPRRAYGPRAHSRSSAPASSLASLGTARRSQGVGQRALGVREASASPSPARAPRPRARSVPPSAAPRRSPRSSPTRGERLDRGARGSSSSSDEPSTRSVIRPPRRALEPARCHSRPLGADRLRHRRSRRRSAAPRPARVSSPTLQNSASRARASTSSSRPGRRRSPARWSRSSSFSAAGRSAAPLNARRARVPERPVRHQVVRRARARERRIRHAELRRACGEACSRW